MKQRLFTVLICASSALFAASAHTAEVDKQAAARLAFQANINRLACANSLNHPAMEWIERRTDRDLFEPANALMWSVLSAYRLRARELNDLTQSGEVADQDAQRGVDLGPALWETHWVLAMVRIRQHRHALAEQLIEKAASLGADNTALAYIRAELAIKRRVPKLAEAALMSVKAMGKRGYIAGEVIAVSLGTALLMQGRAREAAAVYREAEPKPRFMGDIGDCHYAAVYGQASALLLYEGDAVAAAPIIERAAGQNDRGEMQRLASLLPYVRWLGGGAWERAPLTPDEAALELVKWPVGAKLIPKLVQEKRLKDLEARDGQGNSLLILAAAANQAGVADSLIRAGANVDRANRQGQRALGYFAAFGNEAGVKSLLAAKAQVAYRDRQSTSPLAAAVGSGNSQVLTALLAAAGNAAKPELDGLLVHAAYLGQLECAKALLAAGARVNNDNNENAMPALIAAIVSANREVVQWLLVNKADPQVRFRGRRAVDFARESPDPEIRRLIAATGSA